MKKLMVVTKGTPRSIANTVICGCDELTIWLSGKIETLHKYLRYYRKSIINTMLYTYESLILSLPLVTTHCEKSFYKHGPGNYGNMMLIKKSVYFIRR